VAEKKTGQLKLCEKISGYALEEVEKARTETEEWKKKRERWKDAYHNYF
jgi:hypothetical protein